MNIDQRELRQVAQAAAPRVDMYAGIHKALRALMADTLLAVGRMDSEDALERAQVTQRVLELLDFCRSHLRHENDFIHPALEARAPGASGKIAHEHEEHLQAIVALADQATALLQCEPAARPAAALALYRALSLFIAHNFEHMHVEETAHNALLWQHYSDGELAALHGRILASISPAEHVVVARWMIPASTPAERAVIIAGAKAQMPPEALLGMMAVVRPHLDDAGWAKLAAAAGIDPQLGRR